MPFSASHDNAPYQDYSIWLRHVQDEGLAQMPVAWRTGSGSGEAGMSEIVHLHSSFPQLACTFAIVRLQALPVCPSAIVPGLVLLAKEVSPVGPGTTLEGRGNVYKVTGSYLWAVPAAFTEAMGYTVPSPAYLDYVVKKMTSSQFDVRVLGMSSGGTLFTLAWQPQPGGKTGGSKT